MENLATKEIKKIRGKLKKGPINRFVAQKPFADAMYRFSMFIISYYARVREQLKIDYDSFMIIQVTVSHQLYILNKKKSSSSGSYENVELEFNKAIDASEEKLGFMQSYDERNKNKLTISSICLVLGLPKETTRRKISVLCKKNLLKITKNDGVTLGPAYKKIFQKFVPKTAYELSRLLKNWQRSGALDSILEFEI